MVTITRDSDAYSSWPFKSGMDFIVRRFLRELEN